MSDHRYKTIVRKQPEPRPYSPVTLVKQYGDSWLHFRPQSVKFASLHPITDHENDASLMSLMERGDWPRVEG